MKIAKVFGLAAMGMLFFASCERHESKREDSYSSSLHTWEMLKQQYGDSYEYRTESHSWTGYSSRTDVRVENGIVVSRSYYEIEPLRQEDGSYQLNDSNTPKWDTTRVYTESINTIGTHSEGSKPLTFDELYKICATDYLAVNDKDNTLYFETDSIGVLKLCGYTPKGCVDDCFQGITIEWIHWLSK